jgi:glucose-6-phosphate 1-dehydrogenase
MNMNSSNLAKAFEEIIGEKQYGTLNNCTIEIPSPFCLTIFGASGDLTQRKIIPALYRLNTIKLFPRDFAILGTARTEMTNSAFRSVMKEAVKKAFPKEFDRESWSEFSGHLYYEQVNYEQSDSFRRLKKKITVLEKKHETGGNRIFYLAVPPPVYEPVISNIGLAGLSREEKGYTHIVIEKPFGHDIGSAKSLNAVLRNSFRKADLPHGPLSREGDRPEHPDVQICQFDL